MKILKRSWRGIMRNPARTTLLTVLLTVSLSMALIMFVVAGAFGEQIDQIRADVGTDIYLRPSEASEGAIKTMPESDVDVFADVPEVAKIGKKINMPYEGDTLLTAELSDESKSVLAGRGMDAEAAKKAAENMDISIVGTNTPDFLSVRGRTTTGLGVTVQPSKAVVIIDGRTFNTAEMNGDVAVISVGLAKSNGLVVGSILEINGVLLKIVGIFEAEAADLFAQNSIFLPLETAQRVLGQEGKITEAVIYADDVYNVDAVTTAIKAAISNPNMTTNVEAFDELAAPLQNARGGSQIGMFAALAACILIILFGVLLSIRGRMKEIGILKAVGAGNLDVILQFGLETLMIALLSAVIGGAAAYFLAGTIASGMVDTASISVSPIVFGLSFGIAAALAVVGSCIPAWSVARIKPAEVLRYE